MYFKNGLVSCQGEFDNGLKSGKLNYFLNNGQMQSSGSYKNGEIVGRWKWFFKTVASERMISDQRRSERTH